MQIFVNTVESLNSPVYSAPPGSSANVKYLTLKRTKYNMFLTVVAWAYIIQ